jgi:hypothetical protein
MKKLTLLTVLIFSLMFSSTSFADWTKVSENVIGGNFYIDFERIGKHGGYVYFWYLRDGLKPDEDGTLSAKMYNQGDCKLFRYKRLSFSFYKEPMGGGTGDVSEPVKEVQGWMYPLPNSVDEIMLKSVCAYVK